MLTFNVETFKLPCGYFDEQTALLYTHIEIREMTGREEDILSDRKKLRSGTSINQVIANCTTLIMQPEGDKIETKLKLTPETALNLTQGDRMFVLLKLRQVSHGDDYSFEINCPHCDKKNAATIKLSEIPSKEMANPRIRNYDFEVPNSSGGVDILTFKISTGHEEIKMQKMVEQNPDKLASVNLAARLLTVNGEAIRPIQFLQDLPSRFLDAFRAKVIEVEGGVDTRLKDLHCVSCQSQIDIDLPMQESFFLPQSSR